MPRSLHGGTWYDDAGLPPGHALNPRAGVVGPWSERLPHFRLDAPPSVGGDELQTEYFVDRRHAVDALREVRALGERISPHLHAMEIRTVAADDLWLSPAYGRHSVCIGFTWRRHPAAVAALMRDLEASLAPFDPRPHWGKLHRISAVTTSCGGSRGCPTRSTWRAGWIRRASSPPASVDVLTVDSGL